MIIALLNSFYSACLLFRKIGVYAPIYDLS